MKTNELIPAVATHPGYLIKEEIECRNITQKEAADKLGINLNIMSALLSGNENLTPAIAIKLEDLLDIDAEYWLRMQIQFELDSLRVKHIKDFERQNMPDKLRSNMLNFIARNVAVF